jgi:DNA-binding MarR family transcriptional regulator
LIQRAAYALAAEALIETRPNPDHKRAALLVATAAGRALKQRADRAADQIAADLARDLDMTAAASAVHSLRGVRKALETQLRNGRG